MFTHGPDTQDRFYITPRLDDGQADNRFYKQNL